MNNMKDAMEEALKKRAEKSPSINLKISLEKPTGLAPDKLAPESPHADEAQDGALIDEKLAEAGVVGDNDMAEEVQEESDPEIEAILASRSEGQSRPSRTLGERAAEEYKKNKKA